MNSALTTLATGEISAGEILAYTAALAFSGLLLLLVAAIGFGADGIVSRVLNGLIGLAMIWYAIYLFFFVDEGDTVYVFWYVLLVPVLLLVRAVKLMRARKAG